MEIGKKLKEFRAKSGLTQEKVSEQIAVSRQTISSWENEKSYPDIISVIKLSDLYNVSLDELLKGDDGMIKHLEKSTNVVSSNRRLGIIGVINLAAIIAVMFLISDSGSILLWTTIFLEFVLLCAVDFSDAAGVGKPIRIISKALIILCVVFYLGLVALLGTVAIDAFSTGQIETGSKVLITTVIAAVSVYVLFFRKFFRRLMERR